MKENIFNCVVSHQYETPTVQIIKLSSETLFCTNSLIEGASINNWQYGEPKDDIYM